MAIATKQANNLTQSMGLLLLNKRLFVSNANWRKNLTKPVRSRIDEPGAAKQPDLSTNHGGGSELHHDTSAEHTTQESSMNNALNYKLIRNKISTLRTTSRRFFSSTNSSPSSLAGATTTAAPSALLKCMRECVAIEYSE